MRTAAFDKDAPMAAGPALRVVVVDNDSAALELAVTDLTLEGHDVVGTALDGATALDLCRALQPDVAVIDHRMPPGPHGLEVAQRLAADAPDVRVIVFTNYQDPQLVADIRASGATYLPKGNLRALRRAVVGDVRRR
jgi:CheY-like chemotaxis protein